MRVKVGNQWHDSREEPICIQVSEGEQLQIAQMDRRVAKKGKYAIFPDGWSVSQATEWVKEPEELEAKS